MQSITQDPVRDWRGGEIPEAVRTDLEKLAGFLSRSRRVLVLTGAGCSTDSGIPDYRDRDGRWKSRQPMSYRTFVSSHSARRRYWARSFHGWLRIDRAQPNLAHYCLASLERRGRLHHLITQNVDSLHQKAGSRQVTELHGRLDAVHCLRCSFRTTRKSFQRKLEELNPDWEVRGARMAPDGDAELNRSTEDFKIPECPGCGGTLKPAVVFFGEAVPRSRVEETNELLGRSDALLVVGSSLMVWSGYRFARKASEKGIPCAAINLGRTRADPLLELKLEGPCGPVLKALLERLG